MSPTVATRPPHLQQTPPHAFRVAVSPRSLESADGSLPQEILVRIRTEMAARGLTQKDVVDRARARGEKLSTPSFNRMLGGTQDPKYATLRAAAVGVGVTLRDLLDVSDEDVSEPVRFSGSVQVPLAHLGDGRWRQDISGERVSIDITLVPEGGRLIFYRQRDRFLAPLLYPGDIVVVDTGNRAPKDGDIAVYEADGEARVALARIGGGTVTLENTDGTLHFPGRDDVRGVVVFVGRRRRQFSREDVPASRGVRVS